MRAGALEFDGEWADLSVAANRPVTLGERIQCALENYPCDVLIVHRDAERDPAELREAEVLEAMIVASCAVQHVSVIPVRMTEAWLLFDEESIRVAAGNPRGRMSLKLPQVKKLEGVPDPKKVLKEALIAATGLTGRRRRVSIRRWPSMRARVGEVIGDYSPLLELAAFSRFVRDVEVLVESNGWKD